jgi:hypothetical protein
VTPENNIFGFKPASRDVEKVPVENSYILNVILINYPVAISKFQFLHGFRADKLLGYH